MKRICLFAILGFALAAWQCESYAAPDTSDRIQLTDVAGPKEVKVVRGAGAREQFVGAGEMLFVGDQVMTGKNQIVSLLAYDGSRWKVAPDTTLKLEARKPEKQGFFFWVLAVSKGAMWGQVPKSADATKDAGFKLKLHTKSVSMGIRGTEYLMSGSDSLDVLDGVVLFGRSIDFAPGTFQEVKPGQHAELSGDGKISVSQSKGDRAALLAFYHLGPATESAAKPQHSGSAEDCRIRGKGWKSLDGSKAGECVD